MRNKVLLVNFFYDVASPYSYMAFETLCRYRQPWNMSLKFRPFFINAVMKQTGNSTPAFVPNKGLYCLRDLQRLSRYCQVPFNLEADHFIDSITTKNTLQPMRFITAVERKFPEKTEQVTRAFFRRFFYENKDIASMESCREVGETVLLDAQRLEECLRMMREQSIKDALKANSTEAVEEHKAFGAPCMVAEINGKKEMYFGWDRLPILAFDAGLTWSGPIPKTS